MEHQDIQLINRLVEENEEMARLWAEHQELEAKLESMENRMYLTAEEQVEVTRMKKVKLAGRDRIEAILAEYKQQEA